MNEKIIQLENFSYTRKISYPIVISEDTTYRECNFAQETPHTEIFEVSPGINLTFEGCNLINVTVPEGAVIKECNNAQIVLTPTGNPLRPEIALLHDCEKCATFVKALRQEISSGDFKDHLQLDLIKPLARERRGTDLAQEDIDQIKQENEEALSKWRVK